MAKRTFFKARSLGRHGVPYDYAFYIDSGRNPYLIDGAERITRREAIKIATSNRRDTRLNGGPAGGCEILSEALAHRVNVRQDIIYNVEVTADGGHSAQLEHVPSGDWMGVIVADCSGYIFW